MASQFSGFCLVALSLLSMAFGITEILRQQDNNTNFVTLVVMVVSFFLFIVLVILNVILMLLLVSWCIVDLCVCCCCCYDTFSFKAILVLLKCCCCCYVGAFCPLLFWCCSAIWCFNYNLSTSLFGILYLTTYLTPYLTNTLLWPGFWVFLVFSECHIIIWCYCNFGQQTIGN